MLILRNLVLFALIIVIAFIIREVYMNYLVPSMRGIMTSPKRIEKIEIRAYRLAEELLEDGAYEAAIEGFQQIIEVENAKEGRTQFPGPTPEEYIYIARMQLEQRRAKDDPPAS